MTAKRLFFLLLFGLFIKPVISQNNPPNILFITDDMNDSTGYLGGHPEAQTPNIDRLANKLRFY